MTRLHTLLLLTALAACGGANDPAPPPDAAAADPLQAAPLTFDGRLLPANATDLHAPQNTFKLAGWQSDSSWIQLTELTADGDEVAEGDVVARFEFRGRGALPRVNERLQQAEADGRKKSLELAAQLRTLEVERDKLDLTVEQARLDTLKGRVVSARQLKLYELAYDEARFEAAAVRRRIAALRQQIAYERDFWERQVQRNKDDLTTFTSYERRFELRAPHPGVVRHAYNPNARRKVQKGDGMPSGRHVLSIARDPTLQAQFFVPERLLNTLHLDARVTVLAVAGEGSWPGQIARIDRFPQEIGFLREDDKLPLAREKAFVVTARLDAQPDGLGAGADVKVRP
jgi:hypothetical protein